MTLFRIGHHRRSRRPVSLVTQRGLAALSGLPRGPWRVWTAVLRWSYGEVNQETPLAWRQPPGAHHRRHGHDGSLLPRGARRPVGGDDRYTRLPPLLLPDRPGPDRGLLRVRGRTAGVVRQAGRVARPASDPVRPSL